MEKCKYNAESLTHLRPGHTVRIENPGGIYDSFSQAAQRMELPNWDTNSQHNNTDYLRTKGRKAIVLGITRHSPSAGLVVVGVELSNGEQLMLGAKDVVLISEQPTFSPQHPTPAFIEREKATTQASVTVLEVDVLQKEIDRLKSENFTLKVELYKAQQKAARAMEALANG